MIATVAVGASGCRVEQHDVRLSLSGAGGAVDGAEYTTPGHNAVEFTASLPWSTSTSVDFGEVSLTAKVTKGTVGCVITVEGQQVVSHQASIGSTVECKYTVPK